MAMKMDVPFLYGFPYFTKQKGSVYFKNRRIRLSDIWSFWEYVIRKHKRTNASTYVFFQSLLEQSHYFYDAAIKAPVKSQPLLFYYSFLNLAKIIIAMENGWDGTKTYNHGIDAQVDATTTFGNATLKIKQLNPVAKISVAKYFCESMGDTFPVFPQMLQVSDCMKSCVAIHRTYCEVLNEPEEYYKLDDIRLQRAGKELTFLARVPKCDDKAMANLNSAGYNITKELDRYFLKETYSLANYNVTKGDYFRFSQQLRAKGLWYYLAHDDIRTYISSNTHHRYSMESMIYCVMFFFGSITRYHPYFFDNILNREQAWIVSEFLQTLPNQFLFLVTSKAMGITVLKSRTSDI